jgi:hypothetical protein
LINLVENKLLQEFEGIGDEMLIVATLNLGTVFRGIEVVETVEVLLNNGLLFIILSVQEKKYIENCLKYSNILLFIIGMKYRLILITTVRLKSFVCINVDDFSLNKLVLL